MGDRWVGAVLTGGASRRMGRDKATIVVGGVAMADRVAAALRAAGAADVARIGGAAGDVADDHPGEGPLGGALTALRWAAGADVVVAPCDLVDPDPVAFAALAAALGPAAAAVPAPDRPLPAALAAAAEPALLAAHRAGERRLHRALAALDPVVVAIAPAALADADVPGDLPAGARYGRT